MPFPPARPIDRRGQRNRRRGSSHRFAKHRFGRPHLFGARRLSPGGAADRSPRRESWGTDGSRGGAPEGRKNRRCRCACDRVVERQKNTVGRQRDASGACLRTRRCPVRRVARTGWKVRATGGALRGTHGRRPKLGRFHAPSTCTLGTTTDPGTDSIFLTLNKRPTILTPLRAKKGARRRGRGRGGGSPRLTSWATVCRPCGATKRVLASVADFGPGGSTESGRARSQFRPDRRGRTAFILRKGPPRRAVRSRCRR
jgi:hypothetical protein